MAMNYDPYGDPSQLYQQPGQPQQGGSLADFQRDYWAPDRDQVLAGMQQPQGGAMSSTYRNDWTQPNGQMAGQQASQGGINDPWGGYDPRLVQLYQRYGVTAPGAPGSGFKDARYWQNDAVRNAGGDWNYVLNRLGNDLAGKGTDMPGPGDVGNTSWDPNYGNTGSGYGQQQMGSQIASVTPSSTSSSVAPTWAAMLGNTSAYKKQSDPTGPNMGRISDPAGPMTLAQMFGMGR